MSKDRKDESEDPWGEIIATPQLDYGFTPAPKTIRYPLPLGELPAGLASHSNLWLQEFLGKSSDEVHQVLKESWSELADFMSPLKSLLLEHAPSSVVARGEQVWLHVRHSDRDSEFYIPSPGQSVEIMLEKYGFQGELRAQLAEFYRTFAGTHEVEPPHAGHFMESPWEDLFELFDSDAKQFGEWTDSLVVYWTSVGDHLLLRPSGEMAWLFFAGHSVCRFPLNFENSIRFYATYMSSPDRPRWFEAYDTYEMLDCSDLLE